MPLTDLRVRNAKASDRGYKLADSGGLHLFVTTKGAKSWRWKYRYAGKEKRMTFGLYPKVSLADARKSRDEGKRMLAEYKDPQIERRKRKRAAHAAAGRPWRS